MATKRKFKRDYIILEAKDMNFRYKERVLPKAFAKVEINEEKAVVALYVENLKCVKDGYKVVAIQSDYETLDLGNVVLSEQGKGEFVFDLERNDIEIKGIALLHEKQVPLIGFKGNKIENYEEILFAGQDEYEEEFDDELDDLEDTEDIYIDTEDDDDEYEYEEIENYEEILFAGQDEYEEEFDDELDDLEDTEDIYIDTEDDDDEYEYEEIEYIEIDGDDDDEYEYEEIEYIEVDDEPQYNRGYTSTVEEVEDDSYDEEEVEEVKDDDDEYEYEEIEYIEVDDEPQYNRGYTSTVEEVEDDSYDEEEVEEVKEVKREYTTVQENPKVTPKQPDKYSKYKEKQRTNQKRYTKTERREEENQDYSYDPSKTAGTLLMPRQIKKGLRQFKEVIPFTGDPIENTRWWKIEINPFTLSGYTMPNLGYVNTLNYTMYSDTVMNSYKYRHYLFGVQYDEYNKRKNYIYAIPGKKDEQPDKGHTGFTTYQPCDTRSDKLGYWLCFIDSRTRRILK